MELKHEKWRVSAIMAYAGDNAGKRQWHDVTVICNFMMPELPVYKREERLSWMFIALRRRYERAESMRVLSGRERMDRLTACRGLEASIKHKLQTQIKPTKGLRP